jgi:hypothetical protein
MAIFVLEGGLAVFSEDPISREMVMDVLGGNVVKRWRDKFSKFLRHELNQ